MLDEIYFYTRNKGYKKVLEKDEVTGKWKTYPQVTSEELVIYDANGNIILE